MIKAKLSNEQRERLKVLRKARPNLAERAHYILLSDEGLRVKEIAQSQIRFYFLPPYAPEYNPIERFWGWLKKH